MKKNQSRIILDTKMQTLKCKLKILDYFWVINFRKKCKEFSRRKFDTISDQLFLA